MKRVKLLALALIIVAGYSCKETKKEKKEEAIEPVASTYSLVKDSTKVSFTAYKTTKKLPVGGKFMKIDLANTKGDSTPLDALNGTTFKIPVSSLFTNDATGTRDPKLLQFFFGVMKNPQHISGVFKTLGDNKCSIDVTLNGETGTIPLEYTMTSENSITFNGVMDLKDWNALDAISSINDACKELHTGDDGISQTWNDVAVQAQVLLQKN